MRMSLTQYRDDGPDLLARAVRARREELGASRADIYSGGGPSPDRLNAIENARAINYSRKMLSNLEHCLGWAPGSIERVIQGEEPIVETDNPPILRRDTERKPSSLVPSPKVSPEMESSEMEVSRDALYQMMMSLGRIYGHGIVMEVAGQVMADLAREEADPNSR